MTEIPNSEQIMESTSALIEKEIRLLLGKYAETRAHQSIVTANNPDVKYLPGHEPPSYSDIQDILEKDTYNQCSMFCAALISNLMHSHLGLFELFIDLRGAPSMNEKTGKIGFSHEREQQSWPFHAIAVFKDHYGFWYAASPANYNRKQPEITKQVLSAETLSSLLEKIKKFADGEWPSEMQINEQLSKQTSSNFVRVEHPFVTN